MSGIRKPSISRQRSQSLSRQASVTSYEHFGDRDSDDESVDSTQAWGTTGTVVHRDTEIKKDVKILGSTRRKLTLVSLCLVYFSATASFAVISPFFPDEGKRKGASSAVVGFIFGIYPLTSFVVSPFIGLYLPTLGPRFTLGAGLFLCGGCQVIFGFLDLLPDGTTFIVFCFVLRVIQAIGGTAADVSSFAIVAGEFQDKLGTVMGAMETFTGLGIMAGPPLGGVLYSAGGFKLPFIVLGGFVLATMPLALLVLPQPEDGSIPNEQQGSLIKTLKIPAVSIVASCVLTGGIILSFLDPTLAPHLKDFGQNPTQIGLMFLIAAGGYAFLAPLVGWISDKSGRTRLLMVTGSLMVVVSYLLLGPAPFLKFLPQKKVWLASVSLLILGVAVSPYLVPCLPDLMVTAREHGMPDDISTHGIMSGIFNAMMGIGSFLGPTCGGIMINYLSFGNAAAILAGVVAVQGLILAVFTTCDEGRKRIRKYSVRKETATDPYQRV